MHCCDEATPPTTNCPGTCAGYTSDELRKLSFSPAVPKRLPVWALINIKQLGLAAYSTPRGCRSGRDARAARARKRYPCVGLVNSRSVRNKIDVIQDRITVAQLDILALTETWLTDEDNGILRSLCPAGYSAVSAPRHGRRGGGVALIHRDSFVAKVKTRHPGISSFEYLDIQMSYGSSSLRLLVLYRPPSASTAQFLLDFSVLVGSLAASNNALILGDFNLRFGDADD